MHWEGTRLRHQGNSWAYCYSWTDGRQEKCLKEPLEHNFKWCLTSFDSWRVTEANRSWGCVTTWKGMISFKDDWSKIHSRISSEKGKVIWRGDCNLGTKDLSWVRSVAKGTFLHLKSIILIVGLCITSHLNSKNAWYYRRTGIFKHFLAQRCVWGHIMWLSLQVGRWVRTNCGVRESRHWGNEVRADNKQEHCPHPFLDLAQPRKEQ